MKKLSLFLLSMVLLPGLASAQMELEVPVQPMTADAPGLRAGDKAPDFEAATHEGGAVRLSDLYASGPVVLIFYRGAWCPYCNLHLRQFEQSLEDIRSYGAEVLAVSVDKPEYGQKTVTEGELDFQVVSDTEASILENYKLVFQVPEELAEKYRGEYGIDLEAHSGRTDHVIAVPATYVVDREGVIRFAYADADYKVRAAPEQVLQALDALGE